jgi:glucose-1-phosphate thymidylyltransferase
VLAGLIPAAGRATRLGPQPSSKEVLEVGGRPVMDHLVERLRAAAPDEVRVITRPEKEDVVAHARALDLRVLLGHPGDVAASLLLGLDGLDDADEVLVGFPDCLWEPPDGFSRVLGALRAGADLALGLFRVAEELERMDVVVTGPGGAVRGVAVKPAEPPGDAVWGIFAARARVLREGLRPGTEPGVLFDALARRGAVAGVPLSDAFLDVGTPESLRRAREAAG